MPSTLVPHGDTLVDGATSTLPQTVAVVTEGPYYATGLCAIQLSDRSTGDIQISCWAADYDSGGHRE